MTVVGCPGSNKSFCIRTTKDVLSWDAYVCTQLLGISLKESSVSVSWDILIHLCYLSAIHNNQDIESS